MHVKSLITNKLDLYYLYIIQILNNVIPFLIFPYLFSKFSLQVFGVFVFSQAIIQIVTIVVDFGISISTPRQIVELSKKKELVFSSYLNIILIQSIIAVTIFIIAYFIFYFNSTIGIYSKPILFGFLNILFFIFTPTYIFQGIGKMKLYNQFIFISKIIIFPIVIVLIKDDSELIKAIILLSLTNLLVVLFSNYYLFKNYFINTFESFKFHFTFRKLLLKNSPFFITSISTVIIASTATVLMGFFSTKEEIGIYGILEKIVFGLSSAFLLPLVQYYFPIISNKSILSINETAIYYKKVLISSLLLTGFLVLILIASQNFLIKYFLKVKELNIFVLSFYFLSIFSIVASGLLGQLGLLATSNLKHLYNKVYLIGLCFSLPAGTLLIYYFQLNGALLYVFFSQSLISMFFLYYNIKNKVLI